MKRIEELSGVGEVFENNDSLGKVDYRINIYQELVNADTFSSVKEEDGIQQITGKISSDKAMEFYFNKGELTLFLEDKRKIRFFMKNPEGDVQFSGEFF